MREPPIFNGTQSGAAQRPDGFDQRNDPEFLSLEFGALLRKQAKTPIGALILESRRPKNER